MAICCIHHWQHRWEYRFHRFEEKMSVEYILEKLEAETQKANFRNYVVSDYSSEGETDQVWYSTFTPEDFEDEYFPEPEGEQWEEALTNYISNAWDNFESQFSRIAEMQDGKLKIYRKITVESLPKFIYFLSKGKPIRGFKGIGVFWSWDKGQAEAHWGHRKYSKKTIMIEGLVRLNDINYEATARKNLNPSLGSQEAEIEVKKNAAITIIKVHSKEHKQDVWKGEVKLAASFKTKVWAKYHIVSSYQKMQYGYNSYGHSWTPIEKLKGLEVEDRSNAWFDDSDLDLVKTLGVWVTKNPKDALFYIFSPPFRDAIKDGELNLDYQEDLEDEWDDFVHALDHPLEYVTKIDLSGAIPVIEHDEEFDKSYLYIKPVKKD